MCWLTRLPVVVLISIHFLLVDVSKAAPGQIVLEEDSEQARFKLVSVVEDLDFA